MHEKYFEKMDPEKKELETLNLRYQSLHEASLSLKNMINTHILEKLK